MDKMNDHGLTTSTLWGLVYYGLRYGLTMLFSTFTVDTIDDYLINLGSSYDADSCPRDELVNKTLPSCS
jgi:hypothetical protein